MQYLKVYSREFRHTILPVRQKTTKTKSGSRSKTTRARILAAAKTLFSSKGYDRTTIRGVARAADIHPSMVIRYFRSKERLFAAAVTFDLRLPANLGRTPKNKLGFVFIHHFLERWEGPAAGDELPSLLRAAVSYPQARERMVQIFEQQVAPFLKRLCSARKSRECAALAASQLLGLAYTRYVLKFPSVVRLPRETILRRVGATIQSYLR
jgi:AcrR family transcriptional regulator